MKHTVAMLDASTVFLMALDPKNATPKGLQTSAATPKSVETNDHPQLKAESIAGTSPNQVFDYGNYGNYVNYSAPAPGEILWETSPQSGTTYATTTGVGWHAGAYAYSYDGISGGFYDENNFAEF